MVNKKYYLYSPEKLSYIEVYKNTRQKYIKNFPLFISGFLFCLILVFTLSFFVRTPNEKRLIGEKTALLNDFKLLDHKINDFDKLMKTLSSKDDSLYRVILGVSPLPATMKEAGIGGSQSMKINFGLEDNEWLNSISYKINRLYSKINVLDHSFDEIREITQEKKHKLLHIPVIMPIYNNDLKSTGAGFGMRKHPILGITRMHEGIDFFAKKGTKVYATAYGDVKTVRYSTSFGNLVVIDHGNGIETYYGHLFKFNVTKGQKVKRGQVIGYVGSTGLSSGPHLHYEVHVNEKEVDPVNYFFSDLTPEQYKMIIELSERVVYSMD